MSLWGVGTKVSHAQAVSSVAHSCLHLLSGDHNVELEQGMVALAFNPSTQKTDAMIVDLLVRGQPYLQTEFHGCQAEAPKVTIENRNLVNI